MLSTLPMSPITPGTGGPAPPAAPGASEGAVSFLQALAQILSALPGAQAEVNPDTATELPVASAEEAESLDEMTEALVDAATTGAFATALIQTAPATALAGAQLTNAASSGATDQEWNPLANLRLSLLELQQVVQGQSSGSETGSMSAGPQPAEAPAPLTLLAGSLTKANMELSPPQTEEESATPKVQELRLTPHAALFPETRKTTEIAALVPVETVSAESTPKTQPVLEPVHVQTVKHVRFLLDNDGQTVTVRLVPETLGEMRVEVHRQGDEITVRLISANPTVRQALEDQLAGLRQALSRPGAPVPEVQVAAHVEQNLSGGAEARHGQNHSGAPARPGWTGALTGESLNRGETESSRSAAASAGGLNLLV